MDEPRFFRVSPNTPYTYSYGTAEFTFLAYADGAFAEVRKKQFYLSQLKPVGEWCKEQFGEPRDGKWTQTVGCFYFWDAQDAAAFKLRWC